MDAKKHALFFGNKNTPKASNEHPLAKSPRISGKCALIVTDGNASGAEKQNRPCTVTTLTALCRTKLSVTTLKT